MKYRRSLLHLGLHLGLISTLALIAAACGDDGPAESSDSTVPESTAPDVTDPAPTSPEPTEPEPTDPDSTEPDGTESEGNASDADVPTEESAGELLVGLDEAEAEDAADELGWLVRVVRRDGEDLATTMDLRQNRVNVEVTDGEVTAIISIG